jgi:hypothetical protein
MGLWAQKRTQLDERHSSIVLFLSQEWHHQLNRRQRPESVTESDPVGRASIIKHYYHASRDRVELSQHCQ